MSNFKSVERLSLLLNFIRSKKYPSLDEVMRHLEEHDVLPTERTIQRDFKTLRDLCFIEIKYNRLHKGYEIEPGSERDLEDWLQVFEIFHVAKTINDSLLKSASNIEHIDFDRTNQIVGEGILNKVITAVTDKKKIQFIHQSFWSSKPYKITLKPLLLKQYQNRWYVFGELPNDELRTFGLERIKELSVLEKTFKSKVKHPKDAFDQVIGVVYSLSEPERIVLSYSSDQGKYVKTQPLHPTQTILVDNDEEFQIEIRVKPNYELEEKILKEGERVKVITPQWLREAIKSRLRKALDHYSV